jgi:hypothetical protein
MMIDNIVESICAKWGDRIIRIAVTGSAIDRATHKQNMIYEALGIEPHTTS